jgi:hypothetical protein
MHRLTLKQCEELTFFTKSFLNKYIAEELASPYLIDNIQEKDVKLRKVEALDFILKRIKESLCL